MCDVMRPAGWGLQVVFWYARHRRALMGESPKHAQVVGSVYMRNKSIFVIYAIFFAFFIIMRNKYIIDIYAHITHNM